MKTKYTELRQSRDFGTIITDYFDFLKQNLKSFSNVFIRFNGIFILLFLGVSYLMVTGFMGLVDSAQSPYSSGASEMEFAMYFGFGILMFLLVFMAVGTLNYSISSSYIVQYEKEKSAEIQSSSVWKLISYNLGNIILFILLFVLLYFCFFVVGTIISIVPVVGMLASYLLSFSVSTWAGISFMVMLNENKRVIDSFGEGWKLMMKNYWKCIGVNVVMGILIAILLFIVLLIPGILVGVYSFHAIDSNMDIANSATAKIIYTLALCVFLLVGAFSQALGQFVNGILYFTLHEETYNTNAQSKIEQIGQNE